MLFNGGTLSGYIVSDIICVIVLCRMKLMVVSSRFIISSLLMAVFMVSWRFFFSDRILIGLAAAVVFTVIMVLLYKDELNKLKTIIKNRKAKDNESETVKT